MPQIVLVVSCSVHLAHPSLQLIAIEDLILIMDLTKQPPVPLYPTLCVAVGLQIHALLLQQYYCCPIAHPAGTLSMLHLAISKMIVDVL